MIEHPHALGGSATTEAFLRDQTLTKDDLWPLFKKKFVEANPPSSVQRDIAGLRVTYDAVIAAGGKKLRHSKKIT